ncbi:hypothetical protein B0H67DRAFT_552002 [Lasiosphaeris hirsuta]|uniref:R3H domain-containing protein n=1 Tax=Lasiosphaeris hirsuta TaxID=260670 RepID=A0AA40E1Z8_9PEZI|nr:hypothetical protein B0H67DRAFT_552002 [Lasiosphaeris hirsuta]
MATLPTMTNDVRKLSFAKVAAASASKDSTSISAIARTPPAVPARDRRSYNSQAAATPITLVAPITPAVPMPTPAAAQASNIDLSLTGQKPTRPGQSQENRDFEGLKDLKLETKTPNLVVNGSSGTVDRLVKVGNSQTPSDDNSQRADSSSDLGTKPPSLDGKSITSGTTFALDEKESLRPDDSASMKAAAEDDDAFSVRGSYIAGSRMGSDIAARFRGIQLGDMPLRPIATTHVLVGNQGQGVATPQSGNSDKLPVVEAKLPLVGGATAPDALAVNGFLSQNPDEKLLEAMQSPKDRLFLLRLENQVIEFVQDSKEPFMDLPPSNSFCRMLTHKLADYYHMTHSFEQAAGSVRIFRTPFCRIPPSLSSVAVNASNSSSPAPAILPRKIMRRGEEGEFGSGSAGQSKPTSEAGGDEKHGKEKYTSMTTLTLTSAGINPIFDRLTREEREEAYNRARLRIFGNAEKTEASTPEGEDANGVSRASSLSAKDRSNVGGKRKTNKQRRDDSESFDSRSQYVVWCGPQQSTWAQAPTAPQYLPVNGSPYNTQFQQPYQAPIQPTAYAPSQPYPQMIPNSGFGPQYSAIPTYPAPPVPQAAPPPQQQRYQPPNPLPMAPVYSAPVPNIPQQNLPQPNLPQPSLAQPAWSQPAFNQPAYPPTRASPTPAGIPYAYGQLPASFNPHDPKSQHPIPGSYNRQAFNPKSQTFVPANGIVPMQPPNPYGGSSPHHGSPQFNSPHISYNGFQQPLPQPGYGPGPAAYSMARQGSNNSLTQYHHPVQQPPLGPPHGPQHMAPISSPHIPNKSGGPQGPTQTFSHLPNYGNPATLPQKPST